MLNIKDLSFAYTAGKTVLKNIQMQILLEEKACILGESGSGKSTLLKLIAAQLQADKGSIVFNQNNVLGPVYQAIPGHEDIKLVAQDFQLDQYITVREIVGKHISNIQTEYKSVRVTQVLESLSIEGLADKYSHELSGGQQQRVAIAKAIANPPKLLLLDEPFSQLDSALHISIREQLMQYLNKNKIAVLYTSHRADDALGYADKIILMKDGEIIQNDRPEIIYENPSNRYVAGLFGDVNFLNRAQAKAFDIPPNYIKNYVAIYPEEINISDSGTLTARVKQNRYQGSRYLIHLSHKGIAFKTYAPKRLEVESLVHFELKNYRWVD